MHVHVLVRVGMIERQPGGREGAELGVDLGGQPAAGGDAEEILQSQSKLVAAVEAAGGGSRQHGLALDDDQVQAHGQTRQRPRAADGVRRGGPGDHQAGGRQDSLAMRLLDGRVDLDGQTEIVRRDDGPVQ